jgi:ATP-dependent DNA helicase RecQ
MDLPDSLEAYFQEAGRAGRDEKRSFAVLLYETADILNARHNISVTFPELTKIKAIYQALGNFFSIPVGSGRDNIFEFDIGLFSEQVKFPVPVVYNALRILEKEGYLVLGEAIHKPSRIHFRTDKETLYRFQVENEKYDSFIKMLLRSYTGVFSEFVRISENELARRAGITCGKVTELLSKLEKSGVIDYLRQTDMPQVTFVEARYAAKDLLISPGNYKDRLKEAESRVESVISYAEIFHKCRSQSLLAYFGECDAKRCGRCDVCIERNKIELNELEFDTILKTIRPALKSGHRSLRELAGSAKDIPEERILRVVQWLADSGKVIVDEERRYYWK